MTGLPSCPQEDPAVLGREPGLRCPAGLRYKQSVASLAWAPTSMRCKHCYGSICFLDNTDCWLGAQGPVPALLLGTLPPQGCSLLPSCGLTTQDAILTIPYPHEARTRSLLPSAPRAERLPFGRMLLKDAVLCIHKRDMGEEMLPGVQW